MLVHYVSGWMHICISHINSILIYVVYVTHLRPFHSFGCIVGSFRTLGRQSWPQLTTLFAVELVIRYMQGRKAVHYNEVIMHSGALMFAFIFRYTLASY